MKIKSIIAVSTSALILAGAALTTGCTPIKKGEYASGTATIFCDDGFKNVLDEEIEVFEYSYPKASILPIYVSEGAAIDTLLADGTQAIIATQELTKEQIAFMKSKYKRVVRQKCIAVDAVALITNTKNPVQSLSMQEVSDIINGKITRWNQLAGNDTTKIKLVFDNAESSTVNYFKTKFLPEDAKISEKTNSFAQENNAQVFDIVKTDPDALGIISVSWLGNDLGEAKKVPMDKRMEDYKNENDTVATTLTSEVNILKISNPTEENDFNLVAYKPYQAYIFSGEYPLVRKVYMISTGSNSTVLHSFYTFVTGFVGQKIITKTGIMPYEYHARVVEVK